MIQNQGDYNKEVHFTDGNVSVHNNSISTPDLWQYRAIVETICRCFTKSTVLTHWNLGDMVVVLIIKEIIVSDIFFSNIIFRSLPRWWRVNIGLGNDHQVPSPFEPMLTQV